MAERSVCCRCGRSRAPPVNSCNRPARRVRMEEGERTLTRAAASSIARGRPSSRVQISVTAGGVFRVAFKTCLTARGGGAETATAGDFERRLTARLTNPQRLNDHGSDQAWITYRGERNKIGATWKVLDQATCHLYRETRFADSARTRDRDQAHIVTQQEFFSGSHLLLP